MSSKTRWFLLTCLLLTPVLASAAPEISAVSGDFLYVQSDDVAQSTAGTLRYHVRAANYEGVAAWHISWHCPQLEAEHYIRQSDGAPLYVKRINHAMERTVEIRYSLAAGGAHVFRLRSKDEYIERNIYRDDVRDLGSLPQLLLAQQRTGFAGDMHFASIHYASGKVYDFVAKPSGFRMVRIGDKRVRCAIYSVNLDSWLAMLNRPTHILIPTQDSDSNFAMYEGPDLADTGREMSLRLAARGVDVVSLQPATTISGL